jgi:hypothetical protein
MPRTGTSVKPEKIEPWVQIGLELDSIFDSPPQADSDYTGPSFGDQVVRLQEILSVIREAGHPAPVEVTSFDGHYIQVIWVIQNSQRIYANIESLQEIEVMYTYLDRESVSKTVTDPTEIFPK